MVTSRQEALSVDSLKSVDIRLADRVCPILVERGLLGQVGHILDQRSFNRKNPIIVSQKNVAEHYAKTVLKSLEKSGLSPELFLVPETRSSEAAKSYPTFLKLIRYIASRDGEGRSLFLIALGGGVIGDLTGFAASIYRRGIPFIQLPTTLTGQVDSAIGGKTGIDIPEGKNLLGAIYQPFAVLADPQCLETLPERHWSDGFAEVIKYGVIQDAGLFSLLEKAGIDGVRTQPEMLERIIYTCAKIKAKIVERDEKDTKGFRMALNFGHTAGHGIEAAAGYGGRYTHGEAVGIGMLVACTIAEKMGILKDLSLTARLEKALMKFRLPLYFKGIETGAILKAIGYDKKSDQGKNRFILPVCLGRTQIVGGVPASLIREALEKRKR